MSSLVWVAWVATHVTVARTRELLCLWGRGGWWSPSPRPGHEDDRVVGDARRSPLPVLPR